MAEHKAAIDDVTEMARERKGSSLLPLNSKRLTSVLLKQVARAMGVLTAASGDDLRLLLSGKLEEQGREPMNVQVVLKEVEGDVHLSLHDEDGEAPLPDKEPPDETSRGGGGAEGESSEDEIATLSEALAKSQEENVALQEVETARRP